VATDDITHLLATEQYEDDLPQPEGSKRKTEDDTENEKDDNKKGKNKTKKSRQSI
jgi:hypothetical protein